MDLVFKNDQTVRLVRCRKFESKNGNLLTFVTVADKSTYESVELMVDKDFNVDALVPGSDYKAVVKTDGRYWTIRLGR